MFKKWFITLILLTSFPLLSNAQFFEKIDIQLKTGTAIPLTATHFEEYWGPGFHFGGGFEYSLSDMFIIKWDAGFTSFIFNHQDWKTDLFKKVTFEDDISDFVVNGGNRYLLETSFGIKSFLTKTEHFNPFMAFGAGIVSMSTDELILGFSGPEFTTETVPYLVAGLGTKVSYWDGYSLFGQLIYKHALTKDENSFDFPIDFKETFEQQETSLFAIEFGILFDLAK